MFISLVLVALTATLGNFDGPDGVTLIDFLKLRKLLFFKIKISKLTILNQLDIVLP